MQKVVIATGGGSDVKVSAHCYLRLREMVKQGKRGPLGAGASMQRAASHVLEEWAAMRAAEEVRGAGEDVVVESLVVDEPPVKQKLRPFQRRDGQPAKRKASVQ